MVYICIFGKYNKELNMYLDNTGFIENKPCVTDPESEYRATLIEEDSYAALENDGDIIVSFKMVNGSTFAVLAPYGSVKYYTYCDIITYDFIKRMYGSQVTAVLLTGDIEEFTNQLEEFNEEDYKKVADITLSTENILGKSVKELESYIGRKQNENMLKMYDNNVK